MPQQEQDSLNLKNSFNFICVAASCMATTIVVFIRQGFGSEALGFRGIGAVLLLLLAFMLTGQPVFLYYLVAWFAALILQRIQTGLLIRRGERLHSRTDGVPVLAMLFTKSVSVAKLIVEPILCFLASIGLSMAAAEWDSPSLACLSTWLLWGSMSLAVDHGVYEALQYRKLQSMRDARIEQEELMRRYEEEGW